jgi:signal transduction histidine kinase
MVTPAGERRSSAEPGAWWDAPTRQHLGVLSASVAALAGFQIAVINLLRGDDMEVVAASGPGVSAEIIGTSAPVASFEAELAVADEWGAWRFVPHDRMPEGVLEHSHVPDLAPLEGADAWHPLDLLAAPLYDDAGRLRGVVTVDVPEDGRRPGPVQRRILDEYAGLARTSVLMALEREELAARVRMATDARRIVRAALSEPTLDLVLDACRSAVVACFGAVGMWLSVFHSEGGATTVWYAENEGATPMFQEIDDVVIRCARRYWADGYVPDFSRSRMDHPGLSRGEAERLVYFLDRIGIGSVLFVPLGVGAECLGFLILARVSDTPPWTQLEIDAATDIGHDLGLAVANARRLEQERAVVSRLRKLDQYRVELVNTVAHELRNPLTSVAANLEFLEDEALTEDGKWSLAAAERGARRMEGVIDDLLTMARVSDPRAPFTPAPVDLRQVVREVEEECRHAAAAAGVSPSTVLPAEGDFVVAGSRDELHRMLANLVSNAVKYSDHGGTVTIFAERDRAELVVQVSDTGLGISQEDQDKLFREFFRSTNPDALQRPGSGLGLVIAERIARRHGGRITVDSALGKGTTFTVRLPAATMEA